MFLVVHNNIYADDCNANVYYLFFLTLGIIYNLKNSGMNLKQDNVWDTGNNATITIINTSDSVIENWRLTFPLNETISNIWVYR